MYSSDERDLTVPGDVMTRRRAFADEAYRLLEKEMTYPRPSLTLTQDMAFLWVYESNIGDGALAREYWAIPGCFAAATAVLEYLSPGTVQ